MTTPQLPALPSVWDEVAITRQLQQLRQDRPGMLGHFVESLKERFVLRQDDHTAEVRLGFLKRQIEQLKLTKDMQQAIIDINLLIPETAKRAKALEVDTHELELKKRALTRQEQIAAKKAELEIAELEQKIQALRNPPKPDPTPETPQQERLRKKAAQEAKIANLREEQQDAVDAIPVELPDQRTKVSNMYADAIEREIEALRKIL